MNRIREWRLRRKLTQASLAERAGTTQSLISRAEKGQDLSGDLLMRIARALDVSPIDLLSAAVRAELQNDVVPEDTDWDTPVGRVFRARGLRQFRIATNVLERAGYLVGMQIVIDVTEPNLSVIPAGAVVLASVTNNNDVYTVLRQWLPPGLLTTNRATRNPTISLDDPDLTVKIIGVMAA